MRRIVSAVTLGLLAMLVLTMPVTAGVTWCRSDPIVRFNGTDVQVLVGVPLEYVPYVNGPVEVKFLVPRDVTREVIFIDAGFNGHGEKVWIDDSSGKVASDGSFDVTIVVKVPIDSTLLPKTKVPVEMTAYPAPGAAAIVVYGDSGETRHVIRVTGTK